MKIFTYIEINFWNILAYPYALILNITNKILTLTDFVCTVLKMLKQRVSESYPYDAIISYTNFSIYSTCVPICNPYTDMIFKLSSLIYI